MQNKSITNNTSSHFPLFLATQNEFLVVASYKNSFLEKKPFREGSTIQLIKKNIDQSYLILYKNEEFLLTKNEALRLMVRPCSDKNQERKTNDCLLCAYKGFCHGKDETK